MAFLRNTWYVALWGDDLEPSTIVQREICGELVALFRGVDGEVAALPDRCSHRLAPLSAGKVCGNQVECPYHGLRFDASGDCVSNPHGSGRITPRLHLDSYPTAERHSLIWIWMGRPDAADVALIPDFSHLDADAPGVFSKRDWLELDVDYELMTDNLLDLSHINFLHDGLLGHDGMIDAEIEIDETVEASGVITLSVTRTCLNVTPPHMFDLMFRNDGAPVDTWAEMRWNAPGCLRNHAGVTAPGADRDDGLIVIGSHLLTPIDERRVRYHICAVQLGSAPPVDDDDVADTLSRLRRFAFEEQDRPMVEAQQRAYDRAGGRDQLEPVMLSIDQGPIRARRLLADLIESEHSVPVSLGGSSPELVSAP